MRAATRASLLCLLVALCLAPGARAAEELPPAPKAYFNDYAGLVEAQAAQRLDAKLRRFADETAPYGIMDGLVRSRGDVVFAIFDDESVHPESAGDGTRYKQDIPGRAGVQSPNWNPAMVDEMVERGRIKADIVEAYHAANG